MDHPDRINQWLDDNYGKTIDGHPLFRVIWSTGLTEHRKSRFIDHVGDTIIRDVIEIREVLRYPFAQDRWILERICLLTPEAREIGLQTDKMFTYNEIYVFQDAFCNPLPLNLDMVKAGMYLFCKFYIQMTPKERIDFRIKQLAERDVKKRNDIRDAIGELGSPFGFVLE